jgi:RimJ/RimL family protein N-acetyltransferase
MPRPAFDPRPVTLSGIHAVLEPLSDAHAGHLLEAGRHEAIWRFMPRPVPVTASDVLAMIRDAEAEVAAGREVAFAIVERSSGRAVGSTRFLDIQRAHRALEIGWTWVGPPWQRTAINTECKLLLLTHAFEALGAHRVTLKTDGRNETSQRALARIGAVREGVLRRHRVCWDGFVRDSVYFGITDREWPSVRARLTAMAAPR